jgi:hypothetical protein
MQGLRLLTEAVGLGRCRLEGEPLALAAIPADRLLLAEGCPEPVLEQDTETVCRQVLDAVDRDPLDFRKLL